MTGETFSQRLEIVLDGESIHAFSKRAKIPDSTFRQYLAGTMPGLEKLISICEAGNVSLDWLATGRGRMRPDNDNVAGTLIIAGEPNIVSVDGKQHDITLVPRLDVRASAGHGLVAFQEQAVEIIAFQSEWLRSIGVAPSFARIITARGDSMEPTIRDGDVLLIDTSVSEVRDNGIYCVVYGNMLLVKRVHPRMNGSLQLISDNAVYPPEEVTSAEVPGLSIAGRVMWYSRSL